MPRFAARASPRHFLPAPDDRSVFYLLNFFMVFFPLMDLPSRMAANHARLGEPEFLSGKNFSRSFVDALSSASYADAILDLKVTTYRRVSAL